MLSDLVQLWMDVDIDPRSRQEIQHLVDINNTAELQARLSPRISFGTAGLRSRMAPGFAHMNDVTIMQASQGLVAFIQRNGGDSIVVGYDHRFRSQRFAEITASVAVTRGLKVYYLGSVDRLSAETARLAAELAVDPAPEPALKLVPDSAPSTTSSDPGYVHTPLVPFAVDYYGASAGVMVTASHNPANDNGYKVYHSNGCQIIPPIDREIAASIDQNLAPWPGVWDVTRNFRTHAALIVAVKQEITAAYLARVNRLISRPNLPFKFVYTPMHGVGYEIFDQLARHNGWDYIVVPQQRDPDPAFPTVQFPNPEEKGALLLAMQTADEHNIPLVLASDPDADRFSVAVKVPGRDSGQEWRQLTGNELGFLFAQYVISQTAHQDLPRTALVSSTVSSQILAVMARREGFNFHETLTGFKWIGNKAIDLKKQGFLVPFGYEEAIGFMFDVVNDKDGISAAVVFTQMYRDWFLGNGPGSETVVDRLRAGYQKYRHCSERNGYYRVAVRDVPQIFQRFRDSYHGDMPKYLGPFVVEYWRDLTLGYESSTVDHQSILPCDPTSQMITGVLRKEKEMGDKETEGSRTSGSLTASARFTCRGSGTEPKLKVYVEGYGDSDEEACAVANLAWDTLAVCLQQQ